MIQRDGGNDGDARVNATKMNLHDALRARETYGSTRTTVSKKRRNTTRRGNAEELDDGEDSSPTTDEEEEEDEDDVDDDEEKDDRRRKERKRRPIIHSERRTSCSSSSSAKTSLDNFVERDSLKRFAARYCALLPNPRSTIANAYSCDGTYVASSHGVDRLIFL